MAKTNEVLLYVQMKQVQGSYLHKTSANPVLEYCDELCCLYIENDLERLRRPNHL